MSFFNSLGRGFGRSSRKNKHATSSQQNYNRQPAAQPAGQSSMGFLYNSNNSRRQQTPVPQGPVPKPLFLSQPFLKTALVKGSFNTIVARPNRSIHRDLTEANEFFTYLNLFYGIILDHCTSRTCPSMSAGPGIDYTWLDSSKRQIKLPASTYIDYVLTWISNKLVDQSLFPTRAGVPFPPNFPATLQNIFKQMFRIFAHIYHSHFDMIYHLSLEAHWNSFFAHFISFSKEFELLDKRDTEPLRELIENFEAQGKI
ncbi:Mob1/phocein [Dipodascopsis tothii]|uniref:Mob1/phocein n=1 Tax=Dipodascopsis tothii TaxID=44089 RepID=UPI0034CDCEC1